MTQILHDEPHNCNFCLGRPHPMAVLGGLPHVASVHGKVFFIAAGKIADADGTIQIEVRGNAPRVAVGQSVVARPAIGQVSATPQLEIVSEASGINAGMMPSESLRSFCSEPFTHFQLAPVGAPVVMPAVGLPPCVHPRKRYGDVLAHIKFCPQIGHKQSVVKQVRFQRKIERGENPGSKSLVISDIIVWGGGNFLLWMIPFLLVAVENHLPLFARHKGNYRFQMSIIVQNRTISLS